MEEISLSPLLRLILIAGMGPIITLHFLAPLWGTFVPIFRQDRRVSWPMFWRLIFRLGAVVTNIFLVIFVMEELRPGTFVTEFVLWVIAISWVFIGIGAAASWLTHPAGIRGL